MDIPFLKTYQQKNYALLAIAILGALLIYSVNIRKTQDLYQSYQQLKLKQERAHSASAEMAAYQTQLVGLQQSTQQAYNREHLLEAITTFCKEHKLLVKRFPNASRIIENGIPIITNEVEVEGEYIDMVKLVYMIEQSEQLAAVSSLKYFMHKDLQTRRETLHGKIILRNLEETK